MTWKSQPVGHSGLCGALSGRKASESSLAASYLVLVGARIHWLLLVNKPNTVGKMRCEAEDAAVSMPCLSLPLALAHQPPTFSSCVSEKSNTTPFLH